VQHDIEQLKLKINGGKQFLKLVEIENNEEQVKNKLKTKSNAQEHKDSAKTNLGLKLI